MLVAPADGTFTVRAQGRGAYRWTVTERLPLSAQHAPAAKIDSPRLAALAQTLASGGATASFWDEVAQTGAPLVEPVDASRDRVTFLWRGAERNVRLFGGPSSDHAQLTRLGDSDVWYVSFVVPRSTRLSYRLAPDVPELPGSGMARRRAILATAQADPYNPRAYPRRGIDPFQTYSVLELADAPAQPWVEARADVPAGTVETRELHSAILGNTRKIHLYRPAGWRPEAAQNHVLVLFDAGAYLGRVPTPTILDNMIAAGVIPRPRPCSSTIPRPIRAARNCRPTRRSPTSWRASSCRGRASKAWARRRRAPSSADRAMAAWPRPTPRCAIPTCSATCSANRARTGGRRPAKRTSG